MSIGEISQKIKGAGRLIEKREVYGALLMIFASAGSFFLGRLSVVSNQAVPVTIETILDSMPAVLGDSIAPSPKSEQTKQPSQTPASPSTASPGQGMYVGSKNSNKYHLPWCPGAARIAEANKIWFQTKEDAAAKGYTPASNCKGI